MVGKAQKAVPIALTGDLDIFSIQAQKGALAKALEGKGPHDLDLSGIGDVDLSGVQLLLSAARGREPGALRFRGASPELRTRLNDLGLKALLDEVAP